MEDILNTIEENKELKKLEYYELFFTKIKYLNRNVLYKSKCHGVMHNVRVCIYALYLTDILEIDENDARILFDACLYHDIGRNNDYSDDAHGLRGANMIDNVINYNHDDLELIKAMIEAHSNDDSKMLDIIKKYDIKNYDRAENLAKLLKDCDALDRFRLVDSFDEKYLRFEVSKTLIRLAQMLCQSMK